MNLVIRTVLVALGVGVVAAGCAGSQPSSGRLEVLDAWTRPTPATSGEAAIYFVVANGARTDDRLLGGQSASCMAVTVHETTIDDGISRMREATAEALTVPAGGRLALEPNGLHLMCTGLTAPLVAGDELSIVVGFTTAGRLEIPVRVEQR